MLGKFFIYISLISSILSMILFLLNSSGKSQNIKFARLLFHVSAVSIISASAFLLFNILTHNYQFTYIWEYSNTDLPLSLLISTFYAGQEGSFMLWTLFTAIIGIFLSVYVSKGNRLEAEVMSIYTLIIGFLSLILILKSPFVYIWESFPKDASVGFMPQDGRGLNPLLQNFWMAIHPPVLFVGFASLAVPFAFAIAALIRNKYNEWISFSLPWLLFSGSVLGLGIMMGGYWAYGILGWGGYWGWDPVENSSLIPWIITIAVIHTILAQKKTGGYKKINLILTILSFLLVLYSTFLTRSGILGSASVHSFSDPGSEVYLALILFIGSFVLISVVSILLRLKQLRDLKAESTNIFSREFGLFIGAMLLCVSAFVIIAGTSMPIFTKDTIATDFYNQWNLPIAILIMLVLGITLFLQWKNTENVNFGKNLILPIVLAAAGTAILIFFGVYDILIIIFALSSLFTFFANLKILIKIIKGSKLKFGGHLAHIGLALMFLGIIGSSKYGEEQNLELNPGKSINALGYSFTFRGVEKGEEKNNKSDFKYLNVAVEKEGKEAILKPVVFYNTISNGTSIEPDIAYFPTKDLYLSPKNYDEQQFFTKELEFKKGEKKEFDSLEIEFVNFNTSQMGKGMGASPVEAVLKVTSGKVIDTIYPALQFSGKEKNYIHALFPGKPQYEFYLTDMNLGDNSIAKITILDATKVVKDETLVLSVSVKPFINVLWIGTVVLVLGFFISIFRRSKELKSFKIEKPKK
jgi:cytochrome c-type biogenesis protein CcmF